MVKDMRAISPLIATAILLVATVAGGLILYNYLIQTLSAPKDYGTLSPVSATLTVVNDTLYVNVKMFSVGSKSVSVESIEILPEDLKIDFSPALTIGPGETVSITKNVSLGDPSKFDEDTTHYVIIYYDDGQSTEPFEARLLQ